MMTTLGGYGQLMFRKTCRPPLRGRPVGLPSSIHCWANRFWLKLADCSASRNTRAPRLLSSLTNKRYQEMFHRVISDFQDNTTNAAQSNAYEFGVVGISVKR